MKLHINQILERLSVPFQILFSPEENADDELAISQVRLYSPNLDSPRKDALYAARYQDILSAFAAEEPENPSTAPYPPAPIHLLVCGAAADTGEEDDEMKKRLTGFAMSGENSLLSLTLLQTDETDLLWILDRIQDILALYQDWDGLVQAGIWENISVQETFDRCADMIRRPMGIFDLQQNLLMKAGLSEETLVSDPLWRYTLEHGFTPAETERAEDLNQLFRKSGKPFHYVSADRFRDAHRIIAPLYLNGAVFACLGMHDTAGMPTAGEIADFALVQRYLNHALSHTEEFHYTGGQTPWFIVRLLQGMPADPQITEHNFQRLGISMTQSFLLWNFRVHSDISAESLLPIVQHLFRAKQIFDFNGSILVMDTHTAQHETEAFANSLHNLLIQHDLTCARSMVFNSPALLHEAYLQSEIALLSGKHHCVNPYLDCYPEYIRKCITGQDQKEGVLYPGIRSLLIREPEYGRDLLLCLKSYIIMGRNASRTAKELFVHRHTVLYRLEKIETILGIHLENLGEKELALLYLSCLLLLE